MSWIESLLGWSCLTTRATRQLRCEIWLRSFEDSRCNCAHGETVNQILDRLGCVGDTNDSLNVDSETVQSRIHTAARHCKYVGKIQFFHASLEARRDADHDVNFVRGQIFLCCRPAGIFRDIQYFHGSQFGLQARGGGAAISVNDCHFEEVRARRQTPESITAAELVARQTSRDENASSRQEAEQCAVPPGERLFVHRCSVRAVAASLPPIRRETRCSPTLPIFRPARAPRLLTRI